MEMHQIRYFLAMCETLNFTRAAEACNVTQPALSRAIQSLEAEVGGSLFRRERALTHLTDLGRLLEPHLRDVLGSADSAKATARSFLKLERAPLSLGVMTTVGPIRFAGFLADLRSREPGIELNLTEAKLEVLKEELLAGEIDVAVMAQPEPFEARMDARDLYTERFTVAFPPGHRFGHLNAVPLKALDGETYLSRLCCEYRQHLIDLCQSNGVKISRVYRSEREDWIQTMVMAGFGVCFLPEHATVLPAVQTRPVIDPDVVRTVSVVTMAGRQHSPALARFLKAIQSYPWPGGDLN